MSNDFRNFIYVSQTKVEQYIAEIGLATLAKLESETKIKTPIFEQTIKVGIEGQRNKYTQVQDVVKEIDRRGLLGDLLDYKPWFRAQVPVKALLLGHRVFYVGRRPLPGPLSVEYAFQCSLIHHVGIENFKDQINELGNPAGVVQQVNLPNVILTVPSLTSSNPLFASSLADACSTVEEFETSYSTEHENDPVRFSKFFASKKDYELFQANKPSREDYLILKKSTDYERRMFAKLFSGGFGGFRKGLVEPPPIRLRQSIMNLMEVTQHRKFYRNDDFSEKLNAFRRLENFNALVRRIKSDGESRILDSISSFAKSECDQGVEIVGRRLLDGYYARRGSRHEKRVILASPLYLSHAYRAFC